MKYTVCLVIVIFVATTLLHYKPAFAQISYFSSETEQKERGSISSFDEGAKAYSDRDYKKAVELLKISADKRNPDALYLLAECYSLGRGVGKNERIAMDFYYAAASRGHIASQLALGRCYLGGVGTEKNETKAMEWLLTAAKEGHSGDAWIILSDIVKTKDPNLAADYRKKGMTAVNKSYGAGKTDTSISSKLSSEAVFEQCAPACVMIVVRKSKGLASGSGFFVSSSGYLLTNDHVVRGRLSNDRFAIKITTNDNKKYYANVIETSPSLDLALLKLTNKLQTSFLPKGDSESEKVGAEVFAIGCPGTPEGVLQNSFSQGIISAIRDYKGSKAPSFQITVLINHGNSGGPLVNRMGEVIGICTRGYGTLKKTREGNVGSDIQGINFAVRMSAAEKMLKKHGL